MGIGMGGIVPIPIAIGAIEFARGLALPSDGRGGLTHRPRPVGQPARPHQNDLFPTFRRVVMIGIDLGDFVGRPRAEDRETGSWGCQFMPRAPLPVHDDGDHNVTRGIG
jgi:hypothetical protein